MKRTSPLGALARGLAAGAVGSAGQSLFFKLTASFEPKRSAGDFTPPEPAQRDERTTETMARRFVEGMMERGPLSEADKARGGKVAHYALGAAFGAAWALARESFPALNGTLGVAGFGTVTWMLGDNILVPAFRLGAGPEAYSLPEHAYALGAHLAFAAAACSAYEAMRPRSIALAGAALWAARLDAQILPHLPAKARPLGRALVGAAARIRAEHPLATTAEAISAGA